MGDEEIADILEQIIELAMLLDWYTASAQTKNGELLGMYIGQKSWIDGKTGTPTTPTH